MIQIGYGPDDETLQGVIRPPQNDRENPDNPDGYPDSLSDVTADGDTDDDFQSAESSSSQTSSDDGPDDDKSGNDPENTMDKTDPDPSGESTPESSPPSQERPSDKQGQNPHAGTSDGDPATDAADPNIGGNLSRKAQGRAPVKRQRSLTHQKGQHGK